MRQFKNLTKFVMIALAFVLMCTVLLISATATETEEGGGDETEKPSCIDLRKEYRDSIDAMHDAYVDYSTEHIMEFETIDKEYNAYDILTKYDTALTKIPPDEMNQGIDDTREKIELYYQRAVAVDTLAWIYFPHAKEFSDEDRIKLDNIFKELVDDIDTRELSSSIKTRIFDTKENEGYCATMYVEMYTARLNALRKDTDSETASKIIDDAIDSLGFCAINTNNSQYEKILSDAKTALGIQRNQDATLAELEDAFKVLFGDEYAENPIYTEAAKAIDEDTTETIAQMNEKLLQAVKDALDSLKPDDGKYEIAYYDSLKAACDATDNEENTKIADLSANLTSYALDLYRAQTKDDVLDYVNGKDCKDDEYLVELEKEFNGDGGVLDGELLVGDIELEAQRAMRRADLYERLVDGIAAIKEKKGDEADVSAINSAFDTGERAIGSANDSDALKTAFDEAMVDLAVEEYLAIYSNTVEIDPEKVDSENKADIETAIVALNALDDATKADNRIIDVEKNLTELYENIAKQEIDATLGSEGLHKEYADRLKGQVDELTYEDISTLIDDIALIVGKAEPVDSILDRYGEIIASEDYSRFTDEEKQKIEKIATDACDTILAKADDNQKVVADAITDLNRNEAISRISAKCREKSDAEIPAVKANIEKIIADAINSINTETDADTIRSVADEAIFDIQKEFDVQSINKKLEDAAEKIDGLGYLTDTEKQEIKEGLEDVVDAAVNAIGSAEDEQAVLDAKGTAEKSFDEILVSADEKNENSKKKQISDAKEELNKTHDSVIDAIDGSLYLNDEEKAKLKAEADDALESVLEALETVKSTEDINEAVSGAKGIFDEQKTEINSQNTAAKEEQSLAVGNGLDGKGIEAIDGVKALTYLTEEEKSGFVSRIDGAVSDAKEKLKTAASTSEINAINDEALKLIDEAYHSAAAKDLENAKAKAMSTISSKGSEVGGVVDGLVYLSEEEIAVLKKDLADSLADFKARISSAKDVSEVEAIRDDGIKKLDSVRASALDKEDGACISLFLPIAIALTVLAIAEIVALIVLSKKKSLVTEGSAASVAFVAAVPGFRAIPLTAWSVTAVLAVADIVMAVFIVRLVIQLVKMKPNAEEVIEEQIPEPEVEEVAEEIACDEDEAVVEEPCSEPLYRVMKARKSKIKQAIINIDMLEKYFEPNDTVDMEVLKQLDLIPKSAGCIKVLARGELHKPLCVVAREFSAMAKEMIVKAGGQANYDMIEIVIKDGE